MYIHTEHVPVLVVGAGPAGLSMGLFLHWHGIRAVVVERHEAYSDLPSAFGLTARSLEVFRSSGLEGVVRKAAAGSGLSHLRGILGVEQLAGDEGRWLLAPDVPIFDPSPISPTGGLYCPQKLYDEALAEESLRRGIDLRFGVELIDFEQDEPDLTAWIRSRATGARRRVHASYLVAADGSRSSVRERLGIPRSGQAGIECAITVVFRADLTAAVAGRTFFLAAVDNAAYRGVLTRRNDRGEWAIGFSSSPELHASELPTTECCIAWVRAAVGDADLAVEIVNVSRWSADMLVADRFRDGRVFLAGDAAHTMPPTGGFGGNVGIQDAHNLSWKLATVLHGWAGTALLDTYEAERRPVAWETAKQAVARMEMEAMNSTATQNAKADVLDDMTIVLGYRYTSAAVIGDTYPCALPDELELDANPGKRAPHVPIERSGRKISTLDLFGTAFVLLVGRSGGAWCAAARAVAAELDIPFECLQVGPDGELDDPEDRLSKAYRLSASSAILIRPDGFVGWRSDLLDDAQTALSRALRQMLCQR